MERRHLKATSAFVFFPKLVKAELEDIREYIEEVAVDLQKKQNDLEKQYSALVEEYETTVSSDPEEDPVFDAYSMMENDIHKYFTVFPTHTFNPLLLTIFGQFENWMRTLCHLDSRRGFSKVKIEHLAGSGYIEKSRSYLQFVSEIDLDDTTEDWKKIKEIQKIRNAIAHNDSNVFVDRNRKIEQQEVFKIIHKDNRIELDKTKGGFYIKDEHFLIEIIEIIERYILKITQKLKDRGVLAKNTAMPYNNDTWGREKSESIIESIIHFLNLLDENETREDKYKDSDLKTNFQSGLHSMAYNATKLYAFFSNGEWETVDQDYIIKDREAGFEEIKRIYKVPKES